MKKAVQIINIIITIGTIYVAIIAAIFVLPRAFGVMPYIVLSGSMEPSIPTGAVAFINQKDRDVEIGDVVTYRLGEEASIETGSGNIASAEQGTLVTHRIVNKTENGTYITKGDANEVEDMIELVPSQIVGTYIFNIPKLGSIMQKIGSHTMTMILIGLVVLNVITSLLTWAWDDEKTEDNDDSINKEETETIKEVSSEEKTEDMQNEVEDTEHNEENIQAKEEIKTDEKEEIQEEEKIQEKEKIEEKTDGDTKEEDRTEDKTEDLSQENIEGKDKKEEFQEENQEENADK